MSKLLKKAVGLALMLPVSIGMAADLYGGGATFPAVPYVGSEFQVPNPDARLATQLGNTTAGFTFAGIATTSVFGDYTATYGHAMSYCQTGSGFGKNSLTGVTASSGSCRDFSASPLGISAPQVDYAGTDSPVNTTDYNNFNTNLAATRTAIVQIPALVGAVALPFQLSGFSGTVNLPVADVCRVFAGQYTNWNQIPSLSSVPSTPIRIVYRSDSSGTSFAFSNFLAANCNAANGGPIAPVNGLPVFSANQAYGTSNPAPAGSIAASGNANVVSSVFNAANDGAIGYADPGDVASWSGTVASRWALVNGADPMTFTSPAFNNTALVSGQVMSAAGSTTNGLPTLSAAPTTVPNALLVINPSTTVSSGYPIFAVTYLAFYNTGNGAASSAALSGLMNFIYNRASHPGRPSLPVGYAYVNDSVAAVRTRINTAINLIDP